jgi:hypothetical protein
MNYRNRPNQVDQIVGYGDQLGSSWFHRNWTSLKASVTWDQLTGDTHLSCPVNNQDASIHVDIEILLTNHI